MKNIIFDRVVKAYDKNVIVKDLNLEIKEGERLILLGPSGCGKSTTLRMIAGLESLTAGDLYMGGKNVSNVPCGDRNVSMVFQNYALFPHMTVADNITYGLRVHKLPAAEIQNRLEEVLKMLDLNGLEQRRPKELSGGQRQRVALARAVVKRADYFLLDEPLSNLDAQLRVHARKELVKIHEMYGQTLVYVTHDQIEAMTVGHRVALMHQGKLQMLNTPSNVYNRPANVFTARFIGSPSMNIVEANYLDGYMMIENQGFLLSPEWKKMITACDHKRFYFGVRPEHMRLNREKTDNSLVCLVKYVEDYGNRFGVYVSIGDKEFIAVCEHDIPRPGEHVYFAPEPQKIHLFEYGTENSVGYPESIAKGERYEYINQYQHVSGR